MRAKQSRIKIKKNGDCEKIIVIVNLYRTVTVE